MRHPLVLLALLAIVGCGRATPTVWLFGDSITGLYCSQVARAHPEWAVVCLGVGGERTAAGRSRLVKALLTAEPRPDVVLVEEGVNDLGALSLHYDSERRACSSNPAAQAAAAMENLRAMVAAVRTAGAAPIIATTLYVCPVPSAGTCMALPAGDPKECPGLRCFYDGGCALTALVRAGTEPWVDFAIPGDHFTDVLHPSPAGRRLLAERAAAAIRTALAGR